MNAVKLRDPENSERPFIALRKQQNRSATYYQISVDIAQTMRDLQRLYFSACRSGFDYIRKLEDIVAMHDRFYSSETARDIRALFRVKQAIQVARINREYRYQKYTKSSPPAVLPDFIVKAQKKHRQKYGEMAIF